MSSSYKQKKMKTLATRKKTRKRKMELGMTHEDESGRLFQPPSRRDPRWKKPDAGAIIEGVLRAKKKSRVAVPSNSDDDDDDDDEDDGLPEMVDPVESDDDEKAEADEAPQESEPEQEDDRPKPPLKLCNSVEDCVASAVKKHQAIRRKDTRQKAKVLILADAPSLIKALKKSLNVKAEAGRSKSKLGVRSSGDKKVAMTYKNVGPLKTPMDKFKEANEDVLKDYKVGKVPTLLAEDTSFYPFSNLAVKHVIFLAKSAQSAINLDRAHLYDVELHTFVLNDKGTSLTADVKSHLADRFILSE